ncbi:hypothetical protein SASPL_112736 [Salvia splendens]|uniref:AB hydrolase-1 domain-containing protein n=1 Tax=Salvia splendens TaxID=180675 RepID=A0A8X8YBS0_SALSN|nr:hypothetical protein SASPL_112736 [Salvia splendens]
MEEMKVTSCVFVGHSMSAMIGCIASLKLPDLFTRLILVGTSPRSVLDKVVVPCNIIQTRNDVVVPFTVVEYMQSAIKAGEGARWMSSTPRVIFLISLGISNLFKFLIEF